jgi:5'-methylthioadenosine phosphorylase
MLGIIGGTGLYKMDDLDDIKIEKVNTPYGVPSSEITLGTLSNQKVAFLPRHGKQHQHLPSDINFRANIWALKAVGVSQILSVSAVGSLREEVRPGDLAVPNQYFDWTRGKRPSTFFGNGLVAHISTAEPSCFRLSEKVQASSLKNDIHIHKNKTYACVEGPRLGSKAESLFLRQSGCDLVGMTNVPEVFLAREAQMCYCTIGVVTDYDCWLDDPNQHASVDKVMELYRNNIGKVQTLIKTVISDLSKPTVTCQCRHSLQFAVMTSESSLSSENFEKLKFLRQ